MNTTNNPTNAYTVPSVSITTARTGASSKANALGMREMQELAYAKRGEQYLLIKSPPASGKSRALMFIALDKLNNQGLQQAIIVVPERSIGSSFADEPLSEYGFYWNWQVAPQWNLCNAPGVDEPRVAKSKVDAVRKFLESTDKVLVCTHATFRFAVDELGVQAFDNRLIAIDEFHHVSSSPDNKLGSQLGALIARDKVHLVAMTGSYFRGDSEAVLGQADEATRYTLPRPILHSGDFDFSFSGLKTAVLTLVRKEGLAHAADIAAAFQEAAVDVLVSKSLAACRQRGAERLVAAGGVGANQRLRQRLTAESNAGGIQVFYPRLEFCTDNGAMIAYAGAQRIAHAALDLGFTVKPRWDLAELAAVEEEGV